jgi:hypothetical protein
MIKLFRMNVKQLLTSLFLLIGSVGFSQATSKMPMDKLIKQNMEIAAAQYTYLESNLPSQVMPKSYSEATQKFETSNTKWWCSGFYPGTLWYIYEFTKDESIKKIAESRLMILEKEKHYTGNHDLGFMMFCSFGNAYRITGKASYKTAIDTAAMSLSTRYRPAIKSIQSWDSSVNFRCPVIVDNMMNLELLCWVSDKGGDAKFRNIAINHANSTIKNHFRPDNAAYHVLDYDLANAKLLRQTTWQGAQDTSAWARGQAWALYGFTMMYRMTKDVNYLNQANKIAAFVLGHKNLPADKIPYWDYDAPGIPNVPRDASAAAIMASALIDLSHYATPVQRKKYVSVAETIIRNLSSDTYLAKKGSNGGFLLKHSVGAFPLHSEIDVALTYADYYFVEAIMRYKQLGSKM